MDRERVVEWLEGGSVSIPKVLLKHYADIGLNEIEFLTLLHIHESIGSGNPFPTPIEISNRMSIDGTACSEVLRSLMKRGFLAIEQQDVSMMICEKYSLRPLWQKLASLMFETVYEEEEQEREQSETDLYTMFEKEFGRPLSPFECETLSMWIDQDDHEPVIIKAALREAVMSGKLNFRYIDRILFEWKKNGVKTIEQARNQSRKFRQHQQPKQGVSSNEGTRKTTIPFFNWLEQ
jgi:DNA replication protein